MANSERRITISIFVFFTLLTMSSFHFASVEGKADVPTANPSKSSSIQQLVAKIRTSAPAFKSVLANGASTTACNIVVGLPGGYTCEDVMSALGLSEDYFNSINPNIDCNDLFTGQWICVIGTP